MRDFIFALALIGVMCQVALLSMVVGANLGKWLLPDAAQSYEVKLKGPVQ